MSNKKIFDVVAATGKYKVNGQEKINWLTVGALYEREDRSKFLMLKAFFNLAALPRQDGSDSIALYLYPPKNKQQERSYGNQQEQYGQRHNFNFDVEPNSGEVTWR